MTDSMISQNIYISSWDTLYVTYDFYEEPNLQ
jgi:hypothetical protein